MDLLHMGPDDEQVDLVTIKSNVNLHLATALSRVHVDLAE